MARIHRSLCLVVVLGLSFPNVSAQVALGTPRFGSFGGGQFDTVNLGSLNDHFSIPVLHKLGRGLPFNFDLTYDSTFWQPVNTGSSTVWSPITTGGWSSSPIAVGSLYYALSTDGSTFIIYGDFTYVDGVGTPHLFPGTAAWYSCAAFNPCGDFPLSSVTTDGSGYSLTADACFVINNACTLAWSQFSADGTSILAKNGIPLLQGAKSGSAIDRNGNEITSDSSGHFTDTLGTTALTTAGGCTSPSNCTPYTLAYTSPQNTAVNVTVTTTEYTIKTNFQCAGITEYAAQVGSLVDHISLPDDTPSFPDRYTFTYEKTPGTCTPISGTNQSYCTTGRLASVTLPTGGTISYAYTGGHNGIECSDGSTAGLTRATPDGPWTYARTQGTGQAWTTTVTDPQGNQTVVNFQRDNASGANTNNYYETQKNVYQGSSSTGTLLLTTTSCYNGNLTNCPSTAVSSPITRTDYYTQPVGVSAALSETVYNNFGMPTDHKDYDFGSVLKHETAYSYPSLGSTMQAFASTVSEKDGSGNVVAQTTYCYDEGTPGSGTGTTCGSAGSPVATSGTPQHAAPPGGTNRGNLTSIRSLVQGTTLLKKTNLYFDTGNIKTVTDVNSAQATFTYGACGNSFPTSVSEPLGLSKSMVWNCTGGVKTSDTDENTQPTTTAYNDPFFWRPSSVTDAAGAVTNTCYGSVSSGTCAASVTETENTLSFNSGNSAVDVLKTVDSQGRPLLSQIRQTPTSTSFDSTENCYDALGRIIGSTLPYSGTGGQTTTAGCSPTTTYDALGRPTQVSDNGGGLATFTYTKNDVLVSDGPAPAGENPKRRQFEYDGLGRLTSVCELTSGSGSGTCGQAVTQTGYWTQYTYDPLGNLTGVTQNAQSTTTQTRTFAYDGLSRLISEVNPENGATQYFYDTAPSTPGGACTGTFNGDLVKKYDANGNTICKTYDAFHRVLSTSYSGPNATTTNRYFVYDSATVNSQTMANAKTRMAEAYTATCSTCTKVTDEGFSYSTRGELANLYESTPNSAGYYSVPATYWENGLVKTFGPFLGISQEGFTPDGEGRFSAMSDGFVASTTYNTAGEPLQIMTSCHSGTCYPISYAYDPNTLRMTQYSAAVVSNSTNYTISGTLTWNPDSSLGKLVVSNPLNSNDNQTCTYSSDDIGRIASVNCGSTWSQTFGYDSFGNITKSGSISWMPGYNSTTNRYSLSGVSYDSNGDLLYDTFDRFTWDAEGKPLTTEINNNNNENWTFTYDAFGHKVELAVDGTYSTSYITLGNFKLQAKGQTGGYSEYPLPNGSTRSFNGGATGFNFADWLGTYRVFYSYTGAGYGQSGARAPFGEPYAYSGGYPGSFTGQQNDSGGNNNDTGDLTYYFPERHYRAGQGRWASPDPAGLSAADLTDPQSWNRYAYVQNRPLNNVDPLGLDDGDDGGDDGSGDGDGDIWGEGGGGIGGGTISIGYGPGGFGIGGGIWGSMNCMGVPCGNDAIVQAAQAVAQAIKSRNWASLIGLGLGDLEQGLISSANSDDCEFGSCDQNEQDIPGAFGFDKGWYKNPCVTGVLGSGALNLGIDAIGLIPDAGGLARIIGHGAGYRGVVADQLGHKIIKSVGASTSAVHGAAHAGDTSFEGVVSTGLTIAEFIPGANDVAAIASTGWDAWQMIKAIGQCY